MALELNKNLEKISLAGKKAVETSKNIIKKTKKENLPEETLKPLEIGFKVEAKFDIFRREFVKKSRAYLEELRVSGFFSDIWMWNIIFINLLAFIISFILITQNISNIQQNIGINTNDDRYLDLVINKNFLFFIPAFHLILVFVFMFFGSKSQKKLNHLFIASFFQIIGILGLELFALRDFLQYFL